MSFDFVRTILLVVLSACAERLLLKVSNDFTPPARKVSWYVSTFLICYYYLFFSLALRQSSFLFNSFVVIGLKLSAFRDASLPTQTMKVLFEVPARVSLFCRATADWLTVQQAATLRTFSCKQS